jgi:hypothetical protein
VGSPDAADWFEAVVRAKALEPGSAHVNGPVEQQRAIELVVAAERRLGQLPDYVRRTFIDLLMRGEPVPPLPGEMGFRESDWLNLAS